MRKFLLFIVIFLAVFQTASVRSETEAPELKRKLGVGFAYIGGLIRYGFLKHWSAELHYLVGSADSNDGTVNSKLIGTRGYRHFRVDHRLQFYTGLGFDFASADSISIKSNGYLSGGFVGTEYYIFPRLSLGLDLGAYYLSLKDKNSSISDSGIDFILNTFLNFYIF